MDTLKSIVTAAILFALSSSASADIVSVYSQNFDSMGSAGTAAPSGWSVYSISGSHDTFTPADDTTNTGVLPTGPAILANNTAEPTLVVATAGTSTSQKGVQGYNWAVNGSSTNRSLGTSPSGNAGMVLQAVIPNNTGAAITSLNIDYDTLVQSVTTDNNNYTANNYVGIEELPGYRLFYSLDGGATYQNIASLNGDGHTWANAIGTVHESVANYSLGGTWNAGATLYLRWFDDNAQGPSPDQKLGLDNLVISTTAVPSPEPGTLALLGIGIAAMVFRARRCGAK